MARGKPDEMAQGPAHKADTGLAVDSSGKNRACGLPRSSSECEFLRQSSTVRIHWNQLTIDNVNDYILPARAVSFLPDDRKKLRTERQPVHELLHFSCCSLSRL